MSSYKQVKELNPALDVFRDTDFIEGQSPDGIESKRYSGEQLRAIEKEEREDADQLIAQGVGLDSELEFVPFVGTNYIDPATSIADAVEKLDATIGDDFMDKDTYDPDRRELPLYDMDNMTDGTFHKILTTGNQDIDGVKTFLDQPKYSGQPFEREDLINLGFFEDEVGNPQDLMKKSIYDPDLIEDDAFDMDNMKEGDVNKILTNTDQKIHGVKDFDKFPLTPETDPISAYQVANKKYVDSVADGVKGGSDATIDIDVAASGTPPTVSNTDKYVKIELKNVSNESTVTLGSMSAKVFWQGTMAQYQAIGTKDNNTIYYIYE